VKHLTRFLLYGAAAIFVALLAAYVLALQNRPDLKPWHRADLHAEFTAADAEETRDLAGYLRREDRLFEELRAEVYGRLGPDDQRLVNRYAAGSLSDPLAYARNWNRTYELPADSPRGGVLLLHGMSDSPYSLRALGLALNRRGWHALGLRLPGHGTAPAGLVSAKWEDFAAAVRIGARHLRATLGPDAPLFLVGYSTGAALAVEYALARRGGEDLPRVDGLVLLSPAIGVSPVAALAVWQSRLAVIPGLDKLAWNTLSPEYDPYKYGSFAVNAGDQVYRLTQAIRERLHRLSGGQPLKGLPPILALQSVADATVSAPAVVGALFLGLAPEGHELIAFDVNRHTEVDPLLRPGAAPGVDLLLEGPPLPFAVTVLRNAGPGTSDLAAFRRPAGAPAAAPENTGLAWPPGTFSLSHVALPFPPDDPLYGENPPGNPAEIYLGRPNLLGERSLLAIPASDLMRLRWNPFYGWMEERVVEFVERHSPRLSNRQAGPR
jgi:alpha-beta hydrolase superfamily lysophospholipase